MNTKALRKMNTRFQGSGLFIFSAMALIVFLALGIAINFIFTIELGSKLSTPGAVFMAECVLAVRIKASVTNLDLVLASGRAKQGGKRCWIGQ